MHDGVMQNNNAATTSSFFIQKLESKPFKYTAIFHLDYDAPSTLSRVFSSRNSPVTLSAKLHHDALLYSKTLTENALNEGSLTYKKLSYHPLIHSTATTVDLEKIISPYIPHISLFPAIISKRAPPRDTDPYNYRSTPRLLYNYKEQITKRIRTTRTDGGPGKSRTSDLTLIRRAL